MLYGIADAIVAMSVMLLYQLWQKGQSSHVAVRIRIEPLIYPVKDSESFWYWNPQKKREKSYTTNVNAIVES